MIANDLSMHYAGVIEEVRRRIQEEERKEQEREQRYLQHREILLASMGQQQRKREELERRAGYLISRPEHSQSHSPALPVVARLTQPQGKHCLPSLPSECAGLLTTAYLPQQLLPARSSAKVRTHLGDW